MLSSLQRIQLRWRSPRTQGLEGEAGFEPLCCEWKMTLCEEFVCKTRGAFHLTKIFGQNLNRKVRFGSFWPKYSGPPLEVDHFDRLDRPHRNLPFHFHKLISCQPSVNRRVALGNGTQNGKDNSARLARSNREYRSILHWSDWSDCENGKHPRTFQTHRG